MSKVIIWHNPRCSKSREALKALEEKEIECEVFKYLDVNPTYEEIASLLKMIGISARELMRTKEAIYKEMDLACIEDEKILINAMVENPKLIERPIIIKGDKAVIGRPLEKIYDII